MSQTDTVPDGYVEIVDAENTIAAGDSSSAVGSCSTV